MKLRALLTIFVLTVASTVAAQDLYFSISGRDVKYETGDSRHSWDFWIKPVSGSSSPVGIQVFDAGLGGTADAITGAAKVQTTFELFPLSALYAIGAQSVTKKEFSGDPIQKSVATAETRFQNRWVELLKAGASAEGWIVRISASEGDDINNFRLKLSGSGWQIIALDLSLGVVQSKGEDRFQLKPFFLESNPPTFTVAGEEDSKLELVDLFGNARDITKGFSDFERIIAGVTNRWGIQITGSQARLNNLTIVGTESPVLWIYEPLTVRSAVPSAPAVAIQPGQECKTYEFSVRRQGKSGLDPAKTIWLIEDQKYSGASAEHAFSKFGKTEITTWTPLSGRYFPAWVKSTVPIVVNQPPVVSLEGWKSKISPGEAILLSAARSSDPENNSLEFRWLVNDANRGSQPTFSFSSLVPGEYKIRLSVREIAQNAGCTESDSVFFISVNTQPYVDITFPKVFSRLETVSFSAFGLTDSDGDSLALTWSGKGVVGGLRDEKTDVKHDSAGVFEVQLTANDYSETKNASFTATAKYRVNMEPAPAFTIPELSAPGVSIVLDGSPTKDRDRDVLLYKWTVSDGRTFSGVRQNFTFPEPGDYEIELLVDDQVGVSNSRQKTSRKIHINAPPVPEFVFPTFVNQALVPFNAEKSNDSDQKIVSWNWNFGDGTTGTGETTQHLYAKPGNYTVTLTVDDGAGMVNSRQKVVKELKINRNPVASFTLPALTAPNQPVVFDATLSTDGDGKIRSYDWFVDGSKTGAGQTYKHTFDKAGNFTVSLVVTDDSDFEDAVSSFSLPIRVNAAPEPAFTLQPLVTEPQRQTAFSAINSKDADSKSLTFSWKFSDGKTFSGQDVIRTFENPGVFGFELTVNDNENQANSQQSIKGTIRVNQAPILVTKKQIRSNDRQIALSATSSYDPEGKPLDFTWTLPNGELKKSPDLLWLAPNPGVHRITLAIDDRENLKNSRLSETVEILINRPVLAAVDSLVESCTGQIIIFSSARCSDPDGDRFSTEWDFGDGKTSTENNPYHTYKTPGRYTVTLKLSDGFQAQPTVATIPVIIEGSPVAKLAFADTTICVNTPIQLSGSQSTDPNGPIGAFSWDFGDEQKGFGETVTHLFATPGTYTVTLRVNGSGSGRCPTVSQALATIRVVEGPEAKFDLPKWVSPGEIVSLDASSSKLPGKLISAKWTISSGGKKLAELSGLKTQFKAEIPGKMDVKMEIQVNNGSECNSSKAEKSFMINAAPVLVWNAPDKMASGTAFSLTAEGTKDSDGFVKSWSWSVDGKPFSDKISAALPQLTNGKHTLELVIQDNSGTPNGTVKKVQEINVNAAPVAAFKVEQPVYALVPIVLKPETETDADGQKLESYFVVNGSKKPAPFTWTPEVEINRITLVQNDGTKLSNAVDSVSLTVKAVLPPDVTVITPVLVSEGFIWKEKELRLPQLVRLLDSSGKPSAESIPATIGLKELVFAWMPKDISAKSYRVPVTVLETLRAAELSRTKTVPWNPANPTLLVEAPEVNRSAGTKLNYVWMKDGKQVGTGKVVQVTLTEGANRFTVRISENGVAGSKPAESQLIVTATNK